VRRIHGWLALVVLAAFMTLPVLVAAQADQASDVEARFSMAEAVASPFEAHQLLLDFVPGAVAPLHEHGGPGYITMLQGELTLVADGDERVYREGNSFIEVSDSLYEGWNDTDDVASLMVTYLVPEGHDVTTYAATGSTRSGPAPQPVTQSVFPVVDPLEEYEIVHHVLNLDAGQWVSIHDERGRTYVTVVRGTMTAEDTDGNQSTYAAGDTLSASEGPGPRFGNTGSEPLLIAATQLVPEGSESLWQRSREISVIILAGALGLAGGAILLRRRERSAA